jgi:UDP-N-acetylglucosamine 2-epimerase (non-hydrolysing)
MEHAGVMVTDSGGIQEEATFLQVPCLTLRDNTERPITVGQGTNELLSLDPNRVTQRVHEWMTGAKPAGQIPPLWDGKASERVVEHLEHTLLAEAALPR